MRRFEMNEDGSAKFWEIHVEGTAVTVRFGKIGTAGQAKTNEHATAAAAEAEAAKLIRQKTGKGYVESGAGAPVATPAKAAKAPTETKGETKVDTAAPSPSDPARLPSTTPRTGQWTWLRSPGGGREWLGTDIDPTHVVSGPWVATWLPDGTVVRVSLATRERTQLGRVAVDPEGYQRSIALSSDGAHWAVSDGSTVVIDGSPFTRQLMAPVFDDGGALWGFSHQTVVRLDVAGTVTWEGADHRTLLAIVGGTPDRRQ